MASRRSSEFVTILIPLPPPPADGFNSTGKPRSIAADFTVESSSISMLGMVGMPTESISRLAWSFEPITSIDSGEGPIQVMPAWFTARAKSAFSARNP